MKEQLGFFPMRTQGIIESCCKNFDCSESHIRKEGRKPVRMMHVNTPLLALTENTFCVLLKNTLPDGGTFFPLSKASE